MCLRKAVSFINVLTVHDVYGVMKIILYHVLSISYLDMNFKKAIPRDFYNYVQEATQPRTGSHANSSSTLKESPVRLTILEVVSMKIPSPVDVLIPGGRGFLPPPLEFHIIIPQHKMHPQHFMNFFLSHKPIFCPCTTVLIEPCPWKPLGNFSHGDRISVAEIKRGPNAPSPWFPVPIEKKLE